MLTRFALTIWRTSTDVRAYASDFAHRTTGSGLGYLFALTTTLAFFTLLPFAIGLAFIAPRADEFANEQLDVVQRWYPDDLVVTLTGGVLSTNADEPVILDLPPEWGELDEDGFIHAVVIDTNASIDDFAAYETAILLTQRSAVVRDDNGSLRVFAYSAEENVVVSEAFVAENIALAKQITPMLPMIAFVVVLALLLLAPFVIGGAMWLVQQLFLLWATLVVLLVSAIAGRGLSYGALYKLSLFGLTNSLLLDYALTMVGVNLHWIAWLLFFGWMTAVVLAFPKRTGPAVTVLPPAAELRAKKQPTKKSYRPI